MPVTLEGRVEEQLSPHYKKRIAESDECLTCYNCSEEICFGNQLFITEKDNLVFCNSRKCTNAMDRKLNGGKAYSCVLREQQK